MVGKKRLLLAAATLASVGAVVALATGVTFGLFSAQQVSGTNTFTAGTVTLTKNASTTCTAGPMSPGDGTVSPYTSNDPSEVQCTLSVTYGGNVPAFLALDVAIASTHAGVAVPAYGGSTPANAAGLYDSSANGLQVLIKDGQATATTYMSDGSGNPGTTLGGSATAGAGPSATDLLVSKSSFTSGNTVTFKVDYGLPTSANNGYQQAASSITLTAHAVQARNNGSTSTCTVGQECDTSVSAADPAWS